MADYITVALLRKHMADPGTTIDAESLQACCTAASRRVDTICGRKFDLEDAPSDRVFAPGSWWDCDFVDPAGQRWDLSTTTGLQVHVDIGYNSSYATTLTNGTDFYLIPENGAKHGQPWPYEGMVALSNSGSAFPLAIPGIRAPVKVTGRWGWPAVPADVVEACKILAKNIYKNRDNVGGFIGFESGAVRMREDPLAMSLLEPYMRMSRLVA